MSCLPTCGVHLDSWRPWRHFNVIGLELVKEGIKGIKGASHTLTPLFLVSEMTYYVSSGTLNSTNLTASIARLE